MAYVTRTSVVVVLGIALAGCASLQLRPADSTGAKVGKVAVRTLIAVPTLGASEAEIARDADREAVRAYREQLTAQVADGTLSTDDAERLYAAHYLEFQKRERRRLARGAFMAPLARAGNAPSSAGWSPALQPSTR